MALIVLNLCRIGCVANGVHGVNIHRPLEKKPTFEKLREDSRLAGLLFLCLAVKCAVSASPCPLRNVEMMPHCVIESSLLMRDDERKKKGRENGQAAKVMVKPEML